MSLRRSRNTTIGLILLGLLGVGCASTPAQEGQSAREIQVATTASLGLDVLAAPARAVTMTDERRHLLYEFSIENTSSAALRIEGIDVYEAGHAGRIAAYEGESLARAMVSSGTEGSTTISAHGGAVLFLDLAWPLDQPLPSALLHRVRAERLGKLASVELPRVEVERQKTISVGGPLKGDGLVTVKPALAQRFAVDFVRVVGDATSAGDPGKNESYFLYGAEVFAAAPGHIVDVRGDVPENVPRTRAGSDDLGLSPGNFVVEALDGGGFALYAHLQHGGVRVQPGQRVQRGDVLGLVGNTGSSTEPQLHFNVMEGAAPFRSKGLPYVFDSFAWKASAQVAAGDVHPIPTAPPEWRRGRLPSNLDVIAFQ